MGVCIMSDTEPSTADGQYNDEDLFIIRNPAVPQHFRGEVERVFGQLAADFA